jgi:hypothetical protein
MSDQGLHVRFSLQPRKDEAASEAKGEPVWKNVEYIEIHVPGDKTNIPHRPVTDNDRERFARQYEAWKRGLADVHDGYPLREWAAITPAEVNMLAQSHVYTLEQLAAVSDENAGRIGPILALRDRARRHLDQMRAEAPVERLSAKVDEQAAQIQTLMQQLQEATRLLHQKADGGEAAPSGKTSSKAKRAHDSENG